MANSVIDLRGNTVKADAFVGAAVPGAAGDIEFTDTELDVLVGNDVQAALESADAALNTIMTEAGDLVVGEEIVSLGENITIAATDTVAEALKKIMDVADPS